MRKRLSAVLVIAAMALLAVEFPAFADSRPLPAPPLSGQDFVLAKKAFAEADKGHWKTAHALAKEISVPLLVRILRWMDYTRPETEAGFGEISEFIRENPDWPSQYSLRRRAEEAMPVSLSNEVILSWFAKNDPISVDGEMRLIQALFETGKEIDAVRRIRDSWIKGNFGNKQERNFYRQYRKHLTYQDHVDRIERLIWEDRYQPSKRMLWRLNAADRALAEARIMLMRNRGDVDRAIARVPVDKKAHPGLVYERLRWRRRKGMDLSARELLDPPPETAAWPEKWWRERIILARRALDDGHVSEAYRLVAQHELREGASFADAEWFAGWIALRFLNEPETAYTHFNWMYQAVSFPISRARGAYWLARAAMAKGDAKLAKDWYIAAAQYPTTFYGQLGMNAVMPNGNLSMPPSPDPTSADEAAFADSELMRGIIILKQLGEDEPLHPFVSALYDLRDTPGWRVLIARATAALDRPDLGVIVAKKAIQDGSFVQSGYPRIELSPGTTDNALVHALIRQESAFQIEAVSRAGARGLMQLLPGTARMAAKEMNIHYARDKLTSDPTYNVSLGTAYIRSLLERFGGSYVLAIAAYNAGPSRVSQWIRDNGNPKDESVDVIDWIELIPFDETRNYVQRVLENLVIYRYGLGESKVASILADDLKK